MEEETEKTKGWLKWIVWLIVVLIIITIFLTFSAYALVSCSSQQITANQIQGQSAQSQSVTCANSNNNTEVIILETSDYFEINPPNSINKSSSKTITVSFSNIAPVGTHVSSIFFNEGASLLYNLPVILIVNSTQPTGCQINPSIVSYSQAIQQGTKTTLPSITFSPTDCTGTLSLTASSVSIQGGILTSEGQKPVSITSVTQNSVNLQIDTTGLATQQTYTSNLNINAFNKLFTIPFNIVVTSGTTPPSNVTMGNTPTCSISSTSLNLNSTYNLICTNIQPDVSIIPEADPDFIIGTGLETSQSQYIWKFQPIQYGNTVIKAKFFYRNAPIGAPYKQEVKITSSGLLTPGTTLSFIFSPTLSKAKSGEEIVIQLVDNRSLSLVSNPEIYINAKKINSTNGDYSYKFTADREYEIRGRASGYNDLIYIAKLESKYMNLTITPESPDSATAVIIKTSEPNASIYIDGTKVSNPYTGTLSEGEHEIQAIREGFFEIVRNLTVGKSTSATLTTAFKKNEPQYIYLNKNTTWEVWYQDGASSPLEKLANGTGEFVQFTPKKNGIYTLNADGKTVSKNELKGWSIYKDGKILGIQWYYALGGLVALFIIIRLIKTRKSESHTAFMPNVN